MTTNPGPTPTNSVEPRSTRCWSNLESPQMRTPRPSDRGARSTCGRLFSRGARFRSGGDRLAASSDTVEQSKNTQSDAHQNACGRLRHRLAGYVAARGRTEGEYDCGNRGV